MSTLTIKSSVRSSTQHVRIAVLGSKFHRHNNFGNKSETCHLMKWKGKKSTLACIVVMKKNLFTSSLLPVVEYSIYLIILDILHVSKA